MDFLFDGANVPFNGTDPVSGANFQYLSTEYLTAKSAGACASPDCQDPYRHCVFGNAPDQSLGPVPWAGQPGSPIDAETLVVRKFAPPVPGPLPMPGAAVALGFTRKLRRRLKPKP